MENQALLSSEEKTKKIINGKKEEKNPFKPTPAFISAACSVIYWNGCVLHRLMECRHGIE